MEEKSLGELQERAVRAVLGYVLAAFEEPGEIAYALAKAALPVLLRQNNAYEDDGKGEPPMVGLIRSLRDE